MDIFHYHPITGVFLGQGEADESPLEPGVWLIPACATEVAPPIFEETEQVIWTGETWEIQVIPIPEPEPVVEPQPIGMLTPEEKLAISGLTVDELKQLLGL